VHGFLALEVEFTPWKVWLDESFAELWQMADSRHIGWSEVNGVRGSRQHRGWEEGLSSLAPDGWVGQGARFWNDKQAMRTTRGAGMSRLARSSIQQQSEQRKDLGGGLDRAPSGPF
jgi:hypothetical protein